MVSNNKIKKVVSFNILTNIVLTIFIFTFILPGVLSTFGKGDVIPILRLMSDALLVVAFLLVSNNVIKQNMFWLIVFFAFLIISALFNDIKISTLLNGSREYLSYLIVPILLGIVSKYKDSSLFLNKLNFFCSFFLIVQIPFSLFQFAKYGPCDLVYGTIGPGGSGVQTIVVIGLSFYKTIVLKSKGSYNFWNFRWLLLALFIVLLNETKVMLVLYPAAMLLCFEIRLVDIKKIIVLPIFLLFTLGTYNMYLKINEGNNTFNRSFFTSQRLSNYFLSDDARYTDIPRLRKISLFFEMFDQKNIMLGHGVGQFKGGSIMAKSVFAKNYAYLLSGSIPMIFFNLIQIGIIGSSLWLLYWFRIVRDSYANKFPVINMWIFSNLIFVVLLFYNDSLRSFPVNFMLFYILSYSYDWAHSRSHFSVRLYGYRFKPGHPVE